MFVEITNTTWLITICVVPASAFAAAFFSNHSQNKKADEVRADLKEYMKKTDGFIEQLKGELGKVDKAESNLSFQIASLKNDLAKVERNTDQLTEIKVAMAKIESTLSHMASAQGQQSRGSSAGS